MTTFVIELTHLTSKGEPAMQIFNTQLARLRAKAFDQNGVEIPAPADLTWSTSNGSVLTLEPAGDTCVARTVDAAVGSADIFVTSGNVVSPAITFDVADEPVISVLTSLVLAVESVEHK